MRTLRIILAISIALVFFAVATVSPANASVRRARKEKKAVRIALAQRGDPYVYGASGPNSFDCSGLVYFAYRRAGFPHIPRTAHEQYRFATHIRLRNLRRGDLIFYHNSSGYVFHVVIYLGHGRVVAADRPGTVVRAERMWKAPRWAGTLRH